MDLVSQLECILELKKSAQRTLIKGVFKRCEP
nr:MAG TPA: hypothetical protein [Caudoviricetes sp.]